MGQTLDEFYLDFREEYLAGAEANSNYQLAEFMEVVSNEIRENGDLEGYEFCHFDTGRGMRVDGYWFDDEGGLSLFVADYDYRDGVESLTQTDVTSAFKRVSNFFQAAHDKDLWREMEVTSPEYGLARQIADRSDQILKLRFFLVSDRRLSERVQAVEADSICQKPATFHIWDISRLYRQRSSRGQREPLEIDFQQMFGRAIPCLPANVGSNSYKSYLVVMPGKVIADLYERFGARLLEQNVRAFLQNRGNVNRGIRSTILNEPGMFFAYNNGITATASEVEVESGPTGLQMVRITDLQIVNGGQTTASLFHTRRADKAPLAEVFVQMKLSVIDPAEGEAIVPRIAEYANTQNKVNAADLFSNSPFHIRMQDLSRRIYAPPARGAQRQTKWFYERARGQYADELVKRTPADQKRFAIEFPKNQVFTKTDLAKYENVWDEHPRFVNLGAQKNFAEYAKRIAKEWESDETKFNDFYFRRAVARALIFRATERMVSNQSWYSGGYRANIVAYAIACVSELAGRSKMAVDVGAIWKEQDVPDALIQALKVAAEFVNEEICRPPPGIINVTEWCKREACWTRISGRLEDLKAALPESFALNLVPKEVESAEQKEARRDQVLVNGIEAVAKVVSIQPRHWREIRDGLAAKNLLTEKDLGILRLITQDQISLPSEKQAKILIDILGRARDEGISIPGG